ncbi:hypothetical protein [Sphingomonas sp. IW22]|uniref:hypothetical protein n=1 Tax=Sphingomonas sp. IW22 TaxID=3242489 RepID=UPI00351FBBA3
MSTINRTRTAILVAAAAFGVTATQPALAAEDTKPAAAPAAAAAAPYTVSDNTRICVRETLTGSRVPRMICNTMKRWKDQGVDPFAGRR